MAKNFTVASRLSKVPKCTVWSEMTPLAMECGAVNLGQGFPNFSPPPFVLDALREVASSSVALDQQYCRPLGNLTLVRQLQSWYTQSLGLGRTVEDTEILVTNGVTQGLNLACQALINPGDEVITFLPAFDLYGNDVEMAGGVMKYVPLTPSLEGSDSWVVPPGALEEAVTPRTRCILINTPMNVPGKVWREEELRRIADLAVKHDLYVISDEVYMNLVYGEHKHLSIASFPGMFDRTLVMSSAGKTFSCTGWKVGWVVAPKPLITALNQVQAHQSFCIATPLQIAVGKSMELSKENNYYETLQKMYVARREQLCTVLREAGLKPIVPSGGFFVLADISAVKKEHYMDPNEKEVGLDWQFCRWLTRTIKVNAIPVTAFCTKETRGAYEHFVRFAFCKREEDIALAGERLKTELKKYM